MSSDVQQIGQLSPSCGMRFLTSPSPPPASVEVSTFFFPVAISNAVLTRSSMTLRGAGRASAKIASSSDVNSADWYLFGEARIQPGWGRRDFKCTS